LTEYGYLAVVVVIANAVLRFTEPINQAVLPKLTILHSHGNKSAMIGLYSTVTQYSAIIVFSIGGMLAMFAQPILFALTGNQAASEWGAPVLFWFALGNSILVIAGMQYMLQFAHGQVRMHVINTSINAAIQVPILAYAAYKHGAVAVAICWFGIRLVSFFVWPAIVHQRFVPGLHMRWLKQDVLLPLLGAAAGLFTVNIILENITAFISTRTFSIISMIIGGGVVVLCSVISSNHARNSILRLIFKKGS
jgi:O-antigen/teichoic acid export membrane protein